MLLLLHVIVIKFSVGIVMIVDIVVNVIVVFVGVIVIIDIVIFVVVGITTTTLKYVCCLFADNGYADNN